MFSFKDFIVFKVTPKIPKIQKKILVPCSLVVKVKMKKIPKKTSCSLVFEVTRKISKIPKKFLVYLNVDFDF